MQQTRFPLLAAIVSGGLVLGVALGSARAVQKRWSGESQELPRATRDFVIPGLESEALQKKGRRLYLDSCAHCHGIDVRGDEGPDLHGLQVSNRRISTVVKKGIKGEMPSFAKKHSDEDILALIAYLRTLQ